MASSSSTFGSLGSPTATQVNGWAQGALGYAQVTANQTGIVAPTDLTGMTVTVTLVAGRRIKITAYGTAQISTANGETAIVIQEGATVLHKALVISPTINLDFSICCIAVITPTAGAHTYKVVADRSVGTMQFSASATQPGYILVEDIGAV